MARPTWYLCGTVALVATLFAPAVFAESGLRRSDESTVRDGWLGPRMESALELDDEQLARLREMRAEMSDDLEPIGEEMGALKEELERAWSFEYPDRETILNLNEWLLVMDTLIRERHYDFRFEVLEILVGWQREVLAVEGLESDGRRGRSQEGAVPHYERLVNRLELDELQQGHVFDLLYDFQYATAPARELLEELDKELALCWGEAQPDEDLIYEIDADMDALRLMIREQEVDFFVTLQELLDSRQRVLLSQLMNRDERRGPRAPDQGES